MQFSPNEKTYLWLDSFSLSVKEKRTLLTYAQTPSSIVKNFSQFRQIMIDFEKESVYNSMQGTLRDGGKYFSSLVASLEKNGVTPVFFDSETYPKEWKELSDAPLVAYAKGNVELLSKRKFSVVGSRRTPPAIEKLAKTLVKELSGTFSVVTGLADGGDTAAIEGGLQTGNVICVAAGGFEQLPKNNPDLLKQVTEKGLLLSPYPLSSPIRSFSYEYRNKLLAALGEGVLVLSAGEKSGALVTAKYALKSGKPVFALPYPPNAELGAGCNALIKQGAYLTETVSDVLEQFGVAEVSSVSLPIDLSPEEEALTSALRRRGEGHLGELADETGIPVFRLSALLSGLEIKGLVVKLGGNRYGAV